MRTHSVSLFVFRSLFFLWLILKGFSVSGNCLPYRIPSIPTPEDYQKIVYIDPNAPDGGNGTLSAPYNSINKLRLNNALPPNTAYLIKRGTQLNERIYAIINNSYIGAYGDGEKPILFGGVRIRSGSKHVTINDLDIRSTCPGGEGNSAIILGEDLNVSHITIANSYITGVYDASKAYKYPYRAIKGKNDNWTIFNNIISYVYDDAIGMGSGDNLTIVRNYIHHIDMKRVGNQYTDKQSGTLSDGSEFNKDCGDGIHLRIHNNVYIAGNYIDRSTTSWKFALIFKTPWSNNRKKGAIVEYNTFIGNNGGPGGGATVYLEGPRESTFRRNVFDSTNKGKQIGPTVIYDASGNAGNVANQPYPFGIYDNVLIRGNNARRFYYPNQSLSVIQANNKLFTGYSKYLAFLEQNPEIGLYGSDIDPDDFWGSFNCSENGQRKGYNVDFEILNQGGTPVTNAVITLGNKQNLMGNYFFANIEEGIYDFLVQAEGYQPFTQQDLKVLNDTLVTVKLHPLAFQISLNPIPDAWGSVYGAGTYAFGETVTIKAIPDQGYHFANWTEKDKIISFSPELTFSALEDRNLIANFSNDYFSVALTANPTHGGSITGEGNFAYGQNVTVAASPSEGYTFINWTENGQVVSTLEAYTFPVTGKHQLTANFSLNSYNITANPNPSIGGTVSGSGNYQHGEKVTLSASPNEGYSFVSWTQNGKVLSTQLVFTFTATSDTLLVANFEKLTLTLTYISDKNGEISGQSKQTVAYGESGKPVLALPKEGYHFVHWCDQLPVNPRVDAFVTENIIKKAFFKKNVYTLTYTAGAYGAIKGTTNQTVEFGENAQPVEALPLQGYKFTGWSDGVKDNPRLDLNIRNNLSVHALFEVDERLKAENHNNILIYPNPTKNTMNVVNPFTEEFELQIFDMHGRHIRTLPNAMPGSQSYNISWLSPGIYFLNFVSSTSTITKRVVKGR